MKQIKKNYRSNYSGMTLMEVLVALAVFAIVGVAVLGTVNDALTRQMDLMNKTNGLLVADNQLTLLTLKKIWPDLSWQNEIVEFADQQWYVRWRGVETPEPQLRALDVEVSLEPYKQDVAPFIISNLRTYVVK